MSNRSIGLSDALYHYLLSVSLREPELWRRLRAETAALPDARMQISPEQGQLMGLLAKLVGARRAIEVGTFTGYSALCVAAALPADGELIACDVNAEWTAIARRYWREAGLAERIHLRLAPAQETLQRLLAEGGRSQFDFAFIDADKEGYWGYFEALLALVRPGGLITVDNTLWYGRPADPAAQDADTAAIRAFNSRLAQDPRVDVSLLPVGDGLTLARRCDD